jgi:hypothetical protein
MGDLAAKAWRGAALDRAHRTGHICLGVWMIANLVKQAAPANVSTDVRFIGTSRG